MRRDNKEEDNIYYNIENRERERGRREKICDGKETGNELDIGLMMLIFTVKAGRR